MNGIATITIDFVPRTFQLSNGSVVNCFIYDTAGQERYKSLCETYYKRADAVLLVYDISNKQSFELIKKYYSPHIKELCKKDIPVILLGNKADLENERKVSLEEGVKLSKKENYTFKETSCLKNENVADAFETLIEMWNEEKTRRKESEKKTSQLLENRKRSGTVYFKPDQIDPKKSEMENIKKSYSYVYVDEDDSIAIKLNRHGIKSKEKKKCC